MPDRADIWDAGPGPNTAKRDWNDDIHSRPRYANEISADGLISLHTNAEQNGTTATGTRLYIHPDFRVEDVALRASVKCYLEEYFRWPPGPGPAWLIENFQDDLAEIRIPEISTVLIEIAFHTNLNDATKLLDSVFQSHSMKAVEKGWRLYSQGQPCTKLAITTLPLGSANDGSAAALPTGFVGFPRFPVQVEMRGTNCPANYNCTSQTQSFSEPRASPLPASFTCNGTSVGTKTSLSVDVQLVDADGVKSIIRGTFVDCKRV